MLYKRYTSKNSRFRNLQHKEAIARSWFNSYIAHRPWSINWLNCSSETWGKTDLFPTTNTLCSTALWFTKLCTTHGGLHTRRPLSLNIAIISWASLEPWATDGLQIIGNRTPLCLSISMLAAILFVVNSAKVGVKMPFFLNVGSLSKIV